MFRFQLYRQEVCLFCPWNFNTIKVNRVKLESLFYLTNMYLLSDDCLKSSRSRLMSFICRRLSTPFTWQTNSQLLVTFIVSFRFECLRRVLLWFTIWSQCSFVTSSHPTFIVTNSFSDHLYDYVKIFVLDVFHYDSY